MNGTNGVVAVDVGRGVVSLAGKVGMIATEGFVVADKIPPVVGANVNVVEELGEALACTAGAPSQKAT